MQAKPESRRELGRHRCKWEDTMKINVKERGGETVDCIITDFTCVLGIGYVNSTFNGFIWLRLGTISGLLSTR
jgi:hypothetical protein